MSFGGLYCTTSVCNRQRHCCPMKGLARVSSYGEDITSGVYLHWAVPINIHDTHQADSDYSESNFQSHPQSYCPSHDYYPASDSMAARPTIASPVSCSRDRNFVIEPRIRFPPVVLIPASIIPKDPVLPGLGTRNLHFEAGDSPDQEGSVVFWMARSRIPGQEDRSIQGSWELEE
jgi:hypothetical protein